VVIDGLVGGASTDRMRSDDPEPYRVREVVQVIEDDASAGSSGRPVGRAFDCAATRERARLSSWSVARPHEGQRSHPPQDCYRAAWVSWRVLPSLGTLMPLVRFPRTWPRPSRWLTGQRRL
jgi:hypothetical protein